MAGLQYFTNQVSNIKNNKTLIGTIPYLNLSFSYLMRSFGNLPGGFRRS